MFDLNTELMSALLKNESIEEVFRSHLENAMNSLLKIELTQFLGYEKKALSVTTPETAAMASTSEISILPMANFTSTRNRNGHFEQQLISDYARRTDELETTIITLHKKGITTRKISDLIEKIYGHQYLPAIISNISKAVSDQLETFHNRQLSKRYAVIFMDATYPNVHHDSVAKEPLHVLLGIWPDGTREVLDYALYPTESAVNY